MTSEQAAAKALSAYARSAAVAPRSYGAAPAAAPAPSGPVVRVTRGKATSEEPVGKN